ESAKELIADLALEAGQNLKLRFVDPDGQSLSGVTIIGGLIPRGYRPAGRVPGPVAAGAEPQVEALLSNEQRLLLLHHAQRNLGKAIHVVASDAKDGAITVVLEPCATVTGRLLNAAGGPVRGAIGFTAEEADYALQLPPVQTDAEG